MRRSYFLPLKALTLCCFALLIMMTSGCGLITRFTNSVTVGLSPSTGRR